MDQGVQSSHAGSGVLTLPSEPTTPRAARHFLIDTLDRREMGAEVVDVATLLTSELVTNAVRHGRGPVTVSVRTDPPSVRVVVHDDDPALPVMGAVDDPAAEGGRGLRLVELLAARWGTDTYPNHGKDVWFELDLRGR